MLDVKKKDFYSCISCLLLLSKLLRLMSIDYKYARSHIVDVLIKQGLWITSPAVLHLDGYWQSSETLNSPSQTNTCVRAHGNREISYSLWELNCNILLYFLSIQTNIAFFCHQAPNFDWLRWVTWPGIGCNFAHSLQFSRPWSPYASNITNIHNY